jgi:hypothetical protein
MHGEALWNAFTGPVIRGEYGDEPIKVSAITEHLPLSFSLAVLWAEYEDDKFGRREISSLPQSVVVSITRGVSDLLASLGGTHRRLTGYVILRRWKEFLPVMYQEELLARVGQLAFSISGALVDDVIKFLNEELGTNGVTSKLAHACQELHGLYGLSDQHRKELLALHKKTEHALKLRIWKAA